MDERSHSQEEIHMENPFIESIKQERDDWEQLRNLEGLYNDFSEPDDSQEKEPEDNDDESFHSDISNKDDEDDDLLFENNVDKTANEDDNDEREEYADADRDDADDETDVGSEDERTAPNSTDENEKSFPVFNEDVDMERHVFEQGMLFKSSFTSRMVVKNHAIFKRRPFENVRNYGKKISTFVNLFVVGKCMPLHYTKPPI